MELIQYLDQLIFVLINSIGTNTLFDYVLPPLRERFIWAPLYLYIIAFFAVNFKEQWWKIVIFLFLSFAVADYTSSSILKPYFARLRPCNNLDFNTQVRLLVECGSGYSFTSSHATNHFAIALFLIRYLKNIFPPITTLCLLWAGAISYAQVYVGVHYPFDILMGGVLGSIIGYSVATFSFKFTKWEY